MIYGRHRGNGGVYEYFGCLSYQARRPSCGARYLAVDAVERAVEGYYRSIELTPAEAADIRRQLAEQVGARLEVAHKQAEKHNRKLRDLQNEQQKLLQLFYRDSIDEEVLQAEQKRIEAERTEARRWADAANLEAKEAQDALDEALTIIQGCHATYLVADAQQRRLMNQAIFERLLVRADALEGDEEPVIGHIQRLRGPRSHASARGGQNAQDPLSSGGLGSNVIQMVRMRGLEPPPSYLDTDLNRARLPIPPHPRGEGRRYRTGRRSRVPLLAPRDRDRSPPRGVETAARFASLGHPRTSRHRLGD